MEQERTLTDAVRECGESGINSGQTPTKATPQGACRGGCTVGEAIRKKRRPKSQRETWRDAFGDESDREQGERAMQQGYVPRVYRVRFACTR